MYTCIHRCIPQTHGCVLESLAALRASLELEMNSSTDNPLVFDEDFTASVMGAEGASDAALPSVVSAGNFHGEYPAKALDTLALYVGELGRVSAARVLLLADPARSRGLPAFLAPRPGLNSGFMCWELTVVSRMHQRRVDSECMSRGVGV
jgi:histidine ammonia-lyase